MSSTTNSIPAASIEQKGIFFELLKNNVPRWLVDAPEELRDKLYDSLIASHRSTSAADRLLEKLQSPEQFCAPLLAKALSDKLGKPVDVAGVIFQHVRSTSSLLGLRKKLVLPIDRDLLTAACENFELKETQASNYNENSLIYIPRKITGTAAEILPIEPHEFAALCRKLDLGKQYQAHLDSVLQTDSTAGELKSKCIAQLRCGFEVDRHIARIKNHISDAVYRMLEAVKNDIDPIRLGNNELGYQALEMLGVTLQGAMFIGPVSERDDDDYRCVVYLPGDPLHPLKEYASFKDFEVELSKRLRSNAYREFFMRFIKLGERSQFQLAFLRAIHPVGISPLPVSAVYIPLKGIDFYGDPFSRMYRQRVEKTLAETRLLVVPTDDEDEKSRLARWDAYKEIGIDAAVFAASFLPVVGEVLMAVTAVQLLSHVYEGVASWAQGEREEATDHLFDVIENLALMAAFAAGTAAAGKAYRLVRSTPFIERLRTVSLPGANNRLWKPDLVPYRQRRQLPKSLREDEKGLRWLDGQAYATLDDHHYAVRPQAASELWEVLAPLGAGDRYYPVLETNGHGAWRHDSDRVQDWDRLTLFYRFGYSRERFSEKTAAQILTVSGLADSVLRQVHIDRGQPPSLLVDAVRRFEADHFVSRFLEQLQPSSTTAPNDPDLLLHVLSSSAQWPAESAIRLVDEQHNQISLYGSATAAHKIALTRAALNQGQWQAPLLAALQPAQREKLLGAVITGQAAQVLELARVIANQAPSMRVNLFRRIYQRTEVSSNQRVMFVKEQFPDLPLAVAEELVNNSLNGEWSELDARRVPLRLAEEARRFQQEVRACRAYEGLFLQGAGGQDANRLVLDALEHLPGWSGYPYVQVLEWSESFGSVATTGSEQSRERVVVSVFADRVSVIDEGDAPVTTFVGRTREHYFQALWHGLSAQRKAELGVLVDATGASLREKITEMARQRQLPFRRMMGVQSGVLSPMGLAERLGTQSGSITSGITSVTIRRAQELYPAHSLAQIERLINSLGDHDIKVLMSLEVLRLEFSVLRENLSRWVSRDTWYEAADGTRLPTPRASKLRAMQTIIRSWRKEPTGDAADDALFGTLKFAPEPLGELPSITGDFSHVGRLVMEGVTPQKGLSAFLRNFTHLRSLSLGLNHLKELPESLEHMRWLNMLDLSSNQLQLSTAASVRLQRMTSLRALHLDFNPALGQVPDFRALQYLEVLTLRGIGTADWPSGLAELPRLQLVDLRDNRITSVPATVLKRSIVLNQATELHGNPLSTETLAQISSRQQADGMSFGLLAPGPRLSSTAAASGSQASATWLSGASAGVAARRRTMWEALRATPGSRDFFQVLTQLSDSAEFTHVYPHFSERVWNVVDAAAGNEQLRRSLFSTARNARPSADGYSALFSEMEVQVLCARARDAANASGPAVEQQLTTLLRGLFRLQTLEELAMTDINSRHRTQPLVYEHALQISLAYRVGLAERLSLPAQPRAVSKPWGVEVTPADLDKAYRQVATFERSSALLDWSSRQRFWVEYLQASHPDRFSVLSEETATALRQLEGQAELTREEASTRMEAILDNLNNQRRALIRQLTEQALARSSPLALPVEGTPATAPETARG